MGPAIIGLLALVGLARVIKVGLHLSRRYLASLGRALATLDPKVPS